MGRRWNSGKARRSRGRAGRDGGLPKGAMAPPSAPGTSGATADDAARLLARQDVRDQRPRPDEPYLPKWYE
jgi:hypothetical protein